MPWYLWVLLLLVIGAGWFALSVLLAVVIGRGIYLADEVESGRRPNPLVVVPEEVA